MDIVGKSHIQLGVGRKCMAKQDDQIMMINVCYHVEGIMVMGIW